MSRRASLRTFNRSLLVLILGIALLAPLGAVQAAGGKPTGFSCSNNSIKVTPLHSPIFYVDSKAGLNSLWVGYRIDAVGIDAEFLNLKSNRLQTTFGAITPKVDVSGSYSTIYALFTDSGPKGGALGHQINVMKNQEVIQSCTYYFASIIDSSATDSSVISSISPANISYQTTAPIIYSGEQGNLLSVSLDGKAGILEKGSLLTFSPTPRVTWDPSVELHLISIRWRLGSDAQVYKDQLWANVQDPSSSDYHVEYTFQVSVNSKTDFQIAPTTYIQDTIGSNHSVLGKSALFSIIDRPNSNFYAAINHTFTGSLQVAGGKPPYSWSIIQGELPSGLTLSNTGQITGTPTEITSKSLILGVNSALSSRITNFPITITVQDAVVTGSVAENGYLNNKFGNLKFNTAGMKQVEKWTLKGKLPKGLSFKNGEINGVPEETGEFEFTIIAEGESDVPSGKDAKGNLLPGKKTSAQRDYKIKIQDKKPPKQPKIVENSLDIFLGSTSSVDSDGYVKVYEDNQCPGIGRNTFEDPSTPDSPYESDTTEGFCIISEVSMNSPAAKSSVSASNVRLVFDFLDSLDDSSPVYVDMTVPNANKESTNIKISSNPSCEASSTGSHYVFCLGDLSLNNNTGSTLQVLPIQIRVQNIKPRDNAKEKMKVKISLVSDSPETDYSAENSDSGSSQANNGCGNGSQPSPGNSNKNSSKNGNAKCNDGVSGSSSNGAGSLRNNFASFWIMQPKKSDEECIDGVWVIDENGNKTCDQSTDSGNGGGGGGGGGGSNTSINSTDNSGSGSNDAYEDIVGGNGDIYLEDSWDDSYYEEDFSEELTFPAPTINKRLYNLPAYSLLSGCRKGGFCSPAQIAEAEKKFKTLVGNQGRFSASNGLIMLPPGIPKGWFFAIPDTSNSILDGKVIFSLNSKGDGLIVTSDSGWTGFLHVPLLAVSSNSKSLISKSANTANVITTVAGILFALDIQIYPNAPSTGNYQNTKSGTTRITWEKSNTSTVTGYEVSANGKKICITKELSCSVKSLIGPKTSISVVAVGGSKTRSISRKLTYKPAQNVLAMVVYFDSGKSKLKTADITALKKLNEFVKREGYASIYVVGHADPTQHAINLKLSKARAQNVISYMIKALPGITFSGTALSDKVLVTTGKSKKDLAKNRRVEIFVK